MNRDHALYLLIGLLAGFIAGFLMQEVMAERQAPRLVHGGEATAAPTMGTSPTSPSAPTDTAALTNGPPGQAPGGAPVMQEVTELTRRLEEDPNDAEALVRLANLNFQISNWPRTVELFERYLALRPGDPDVLSDLGLSYRQMGQPQRALELFDQAQQQAPDHWQSRFNEALVLALDFQRFTEAEAVLEELRALAPGNPDIDRLADEIARRRDAA